MKYLLDTCAISEPVKKQPNIGFIAWLNKQHERNLYLSVLTLGELRKGVSKLKETEPRKKRLNKWIEEDLKNRFEDRLVDIDTAVATRWGQILGEGEKKGRIIPVIDALIAATAMVYDLVVVTRNHKDLEGYGLEIENPWLS